MTSFRIFIFVYSLPHSTSKNILFILCLQYYDCLISCLTQVIENTHNYKDDFFFHLMVPSLVSSCQELILMQVFTDLKSYSTHLQHLLISLCSFDLISIMVEMKSKVEKVYLIQSFYFDFHMV